MVTTTIRSLTGELNPECAEQVVIGKQIGKVAIRSPAPEEADVHKDERNADGRYQRRQPRRIAQRPVDEVVHAQVQPAAEKRHEQQQKQHTAGRRAGTRGGFQSQGGENREGKKTAQHKQVAVREIDQPDDPVDHRVSQCDQRKQRTVREPDEAMLQKQFKRTRLLASEKQLGNSRKITYPAGRLAGSARKRTRLLTSEKKLLAEQLDKLEFSVLDRDAAHFG